MKLKTRRFLISAGILFIVIGIAFLCFVVFRFDNRISIGSKPILFRNEQSVVRLDSVVLNPDSISSFVDRLMKKAHVYGMAVAIFNRHDVVYQNYFGTRNYQKNEPYEPGTLFYGASLSKTVFADIVLQLAEENVIDLDTPLYRYLPEPLYAYKTNRVSQFFGVNVIDYSALEGDARFKKITARMCLSHTSGLPNWRWIEPDKKLKIKFDPGTRYSYSGEGMFLLQFVLEEITKRKLEEIAIEKVFDILHMERSSFIWQKAYEGHYAVGHDIHGNNLRIPKSTVSNGAGSLTTTLEDYSIFFKDVLQQNHTRYKQMITPQIRITSKQQFGPNAGVDVHDNDSIRLSYGLGFGVYQTRYGKAFFKEGHLEGWQHYVVGFPESGTGLILMANSDGAESIFKELIEYITGNTSTPWYWEGYLPIKE